MSLRNPFAVFLIFVVVALMSVTTAIAANDASNGAFVVNHGQQMGDNCTAKVGSNLYTGYIDHFVVNPSGVINLGCQLWGPPVANTTDYNGLRVNPNGHAVLSQNGN